MNVFETKQPLSETIITVLEGTPISLVESQAIRILLVKIGIICSCL